MTDRLSRFTPTAPGLDRDAILFAAGRRSARGSWVWKATAALLVVSQASTLAVYWPRAPKAGNPDSPPAAVAPAPEPVAPPASPPADVWTAGSSPDVLQAPPRVAATQFVPADAPLTVRSAVPDA